MRSYYSLGNSVFSIKVFHEIFVKYTKYHLHFPRISWTLTPDKLALEVDGKSVERPLNKDASISDKDITFFIHLNTVDAETDSWGLFMPNKRCAFFHISIPVVYSDTHLNFKLHKDPRLTQMQKFHFFEVLYTFSKFLLTLQNWKQLILQRGTWNKYKGNGSLRLWRLTSITSLALR